MPPRQPTLLAATTGLPWDTGITVTIRCWKCNSKNKSVFRRCAVCARVHCGSCFDQEGFEHQCSSGPAAGPFPTFHQERGVLGIFGMGMDAREDDRGGHDGTWKWVPTEKAREIAPEAELVGESIVGFSASVAETRRPARNSNKREPAIGNQMSLPVTAGIKRAHSADDLSPGSIGNSPMPRKLRRSRRQEELGSIKEEPSYSEVSAKNTIDDKSNVKAEVHSDTKNLATDDEDIDVTLRAQRTRGVNTARSYRLDVRGLDYLRITLNPGFRVRGQEDEDATVSIPFQLDYQWHNRTQLARVERNAVALLTGENDDLQIDTQQVVGDDWQYTGPGLTVDMHNAFLRAIANDMQAAESPAAIWAESSVREEADNVREEADNVREEKDNVRDGEEEQDDDDPSGDEQSVYGDVVVPAPIVRRGLGGTLTR